MTGKKVCMFVYNNCKSDARVLKEAKTLTDAGYKVRVIAVLTGDVEPYELRDGFEIIRVVKNPLHYRILKSVRYFFSGIKRKVRKVRKVIYKILYLFFKVFTYPVRFFKKKKSEETKEKDKPGRLRKAYVYFVIDVRRNGLTKYVKKAIKKKPIQFILFGWLVVLVYYTLKFINIIAGLLFASVSKGVYNGIKHFLMNFHRPLCFSDYYKRSYKIIKESPDDIFHAHDLNTLWIAYKAKKKFRGKLVYDSHELYVERNKLSKTPMLKKIATRKYEAYLCKKCDAVITVGECIAEYLRDKYNIKKPQVVMNAPSRDARRIIGIIDLRAELGVNFDQKLLLYSGGITFNRGLEKLIESLKLLPNCYLVFLGYGNDNFKDALKEVAKKYKVQDRFSFFGPVLPHEVPSYVASADLGIAPIENVCLSYYFCAPNKIFEYLVGGIPVIGSDFPELKKVIEGNNIGYTFSPDDAQSIAGSVQRIFEDTERYLQMKINTIAAAEKYNWENEAEKLELIYEQLGKNVYRKPA